MEQMFSVRIMTDGKIPTSLDVKEYLEEAHELFQQDEDNYKPIQATVEDL